MSISRRRKVWLFILAIPVVLAVVAVVALKLIFTGERLKEMVIPRVEAATGRTVAVGEMSLSVFPSIAFTMDSVAVSNRRGAGFSPRPFLVLDGLRVNVRLLPLLRSSIEVTSVAFDRPQLFLEVNAQNSTNYEDLTASGGGAQAGAPQGASGGTSEAPPGRGTAPETGKPAAPPSGGAAALLVADLVVNHGSVEYVNHKENSATGARDLSLRMSLGREGSDVVVSGDASTDSLSYGAVDAPMFSGLHLALAARARYVAADDRVTIERGDMRFQSMPLRVSGTVDHVRATPAFDIVIGADSLNIADLLSLVPAEYMGKVEGLKGEGTAHVRIGVKGTVTDSTSADITGTVTAAGASIRYPQLPRPVTDISIVSGFSRTAKRQEFRIENLTASLGGAPVHMSLTLSDFNDPSIDCAAGGSLDLAAVHEFYPLAKGTELGGAVSAEFRVAGRVSAPAAMRASGSLTLRDVSVKTAASPKPVRDLNGTLTFSNDALSTKQVSLVIGQSDMTLSCTVKNYLSLVTGEKNSPRCIATMALHAGHLYTSDIMAPPPGPAGPGGPAPPGAGSPASTPAPRGGTAAPLHAPGNASPRNVSGKSAFPLPAVEIEANADIGTLTMEKFEFTNVRGALHAADGVVTMKNLSLGAFGGTVVSNGSLDLNRPERPVFDLSLTLNGVDASALLSHFTSFGSRLSGALSTTTALKGALNDTLGLVPDALQGGGNVGIRNGALKGVKVNQSLASQLKLPDLENIQFKDWTNAYTVQNGRLVLKDLTITASVGQYVINGSQGLDGSLDYHMTLYLPESAAPKLNIAGFAGEAVDLFKDQNGRLKLDFNVGGTMDDPKVQLDTGAARKKAEDLAKQKLQNAAKSKANELLKKLFKK